MAEVMDRECEQVDNKRGLRIQFWKIQTVLKKKSEKEAKKEVPEREKTQESAVTKRRLEEPREEAVSRMEKPTE